MKKILRVSTIAVLAVALVSLSACTFMAELFGAAIMSVSGKAVNVMATVSATTDEYWKGQDATGVAVSLDGAIITLTSLKAGDTAKPYTATVASDGTWTATGVSSGKYTVSGVKTGWTFIPMTIELSGVLTEVSSELMAYPKQDDATIMLIVKWDNPKIDVDSYAIIDRNPLDPNFVGTTAVPYQSSYVGQVSPLTSTTYQWPSTGDAKVKLDRDVKFQTTTATAVTGSLVETIRIVSNPIGAGSTGWLRYYINSWSYYDGSSQVIDNGWDDSTGVIRGGTLTGNPDAATFKEGAGGVVYVMQGNTLFGTWVLPVDTAENNLAIVNINFYPNASNAAATDYLFYSYSNTGYEPKALGTIVPVGVKVIQ